MTQLPKEEASAANGDGIDQRALDAGQAFDQSMQDPGPVDIGALAVAAATAAGEFRPGADTATDAISRCIVMDNMTEKVEKVVVREDVPSGTNVTVEYVDGYFDASGDRVATVTGTAVVITTTPHMWQFHRSTAELADGSFLVTGLIDTTAAMTRGQTQILQITGTGGRYLGRAGYMTLAVKDPTLRPPHYATTFVLC